MGVVALCVVCVVLFGCAELLMRAISRLCGSRRLALPDAVLADHTPAAEELVQPLNEAILHDPRLGGEDFVDYCAAIVSAVGGRSFRNRGESWVSRVADVGSVMTAMCDWRAVPGNILKWVHLVETVAASGDHDAAGFLARHVSPFASMLHVPRFHPASTLSCAVCSTLRP